MPGRVCPFLLKQFRLEVVCILVVRARLVHALGWFQLHTQVYTDLKRQLDEGGTCVYGKDTTMAT